MDTSITSCENFDTSNPSGWWSFLSNKPGALSEGVEIMCLGPHDPTRVAAACAYMLAGCTLEDGEFAFSEIHVVYPPGYGYPLEEKNFHQAIFQGIPADANVEIEHYAQRVRERITLHFRSNLIGDQLVQEVRSFSPRSAILIIEGDGYETGAPTAPPKKTEVSKPGSSSMFYLADWVWSDRLARLAERFNARAKGSQQVVFFFSQEYGPANQESKDRLLKLDNIGFAYFSPPVDAQMVAENQDKWSHKLRAGDVNSIMSELDKAPIGQVNRDLIKAQALHAAGASALGFSKIESHLEFLMEESSPQVLLKIALIAYRGGKRRESLRLLRSALARGIRDEPFLGVAIDLARDLGANEELRELGSQIGRLFPGSDIAIQADFFECRSRSDYEKFAERMRSLVEEQRLSKEGSLLYMLAVAFSSSSDLSAVLSEIGRELPEASDRAVLMAARWTLDNGHPLDSSKLCIEHDWKVGTKWERYAVQMVLGATEGILLRLGESDPNQGGISHLCRCFIFVSTYLRAHPFDAELRLRFAEVVSPDTAGAYGFLILAELTVRGAKPRSTVIYKHQDREDAIPIHDYLKFFERVVQGSDGTNLTLLGQGVLPDTGGYGERRLLDQTWFLIEAFGTKSADPDHCKMLVGLLHVGLLLVARVGRPGEGAELTGRVAMSLVLGGHAQLGRDLVEQMLLTADPEKREDLTAAWLEYTEVYLWCHRPHEAIVWLNIALVDTSYPWLPLAVYQAASLAARALRDLSLPDLALNALDWLRLVTEEAGLRDAARERVDSVENGIELVMLRQKGISGSENERRARALADRLVRQLEEARERGGEVLPIASLLASTVILMAANGLFVDNYVAMLRATVDLLEGPPRALVLALIEPSLSSESVRAFARGLDDTRDPESASTDVLFAPVFARRALDRANEANPSENLALLEWLTDRSVQVGSKEIEHEDREARNLLARELTGGLVGGDFAVQMLGQPGRASMEALAERSNVPLEASELASFAKQLSRSGVDVYAFASTLLDEKGVILVSAVDGELASQAISADIFDIKAFEDWRHLYPQGYVANAPSAGFDVNGFERTLAKIGLPLGSNGNTALIVSDVRFQSIPPNLILADNTLSGLRRPMASAPSLTWLHAIQQRARRASGNRVAWIPLPQKSISDSLLGTPLELLNAVTELALVENGFSVFTGREAPATLQGADIAIVGAHGGLHEATSWFRVVADEESLRLSASAMAEALRGAEVAILFICSAGRLDAHPFSTATMGLTQVLLRNGCRAVLASPWPLDVSVPNYWLPAFLAEWKGSVTLAEANFRANQVVEDKYSSHPSHRLAMNLFGDPLLCSGSSTAH